MKIYFTITLLFTFYFSAFSQSDVISKSHKYNLGFDHVDHIILYPPDMDLIKSEDFEDEKNGSMMKIGRLLSTDLSITNSGTWEEINDRTKVWRLRISSEGAKACALHFNSLKIPENSELFVYDINNSILLGPYTNLDNPEGQEYVIGVLKGNDIIIEYYSPINSDDSLKLEICSFAYIYRGENLFDSKEKSTGYGTSGECQVNINCPEGNNWRKQQKGVARIYAIDGIYVGYCTGTLINNTSNDGTPYFLTAFHCGETTTESQFKQWKFRFDYESDGCTSPSEPLGYTINGCTKIASAPLGGGSDFLLVELNTTSEFLKNKNAVYNGWNNENIGSTNGVCIHHPNGDIKKISTYTDNLTSSSYRNSDGTTGANNAFWRVMWSKTETGYGVTEGGSSGSPIFNKDGLIIGTLTGGTTYCSDPRGYDYYGKLSYHWASNSSSADSQLNTWLDPINSGTKTCNYLDLNEYMAVDFTGTPQTIEAGKTVSFVDNSKNLGTEPIYHWTFQGGIPSTSSEKNPIITYYKDGVFDVSLTVDRGDKSLTEIKKAYIKVDNNLIDIENNLLSQINIYPNPTSDILNIVIPENIDNIVIKILDLAGHEILNEEIKGTYLFDLSFLNPGLYFLNITNTESNFVKKISIK